MIEEEFGWWPSIAVDPLGGVHVVWSAGQQRDHGFPVDVLMYRYNGDDGWGDASDVLAARDFGYTVRNGVTVTPDGMVHVVYRNWVEIFYARAPLDAASSPQMWTRPRLISGMEAAYYADIASDSQGVLHAVWSAQASTTIEYGANLDCLACSDVYYRRSEDGGKSWSAPIDLSRSAWGSVKPRVRAYDDGTVYVTWEEGFDWYVSSGDVKGVGVIISNDGGVTWGDPVHFGRPVYNPSAIRLAFGEEARWFGDDAPQEIALSKDGAGNLVIAYRRVVDATRSLLDRRLYYQVSRDGGGTWSAPDVIEGAVSRSSQDTGLDSFDMVTDSAGNLHLAFVGAGNEDETGTSVFHVVWDGDSWGEPERVYYSEDYSEWPRLAIDSGDGLHLVWHVRPANQVFSLSGSAGDIDVWYAARPGGPLREATLAPTPTPSPTVTLAPTATRNATPYPTPPPAAPGFSGRSTVDEAATQIVLVAVLPVLALVVIVMLLRRFRPRS
ncbi:MAG: exo-alpha-sialidase [Anaerolineae bacterium]|nr:exo-alpha-sialidase [Anaerolineae bacterium]